MRTAVVAFVVMIYGSALPAQITPQPPAFGATNTLSPGETLVPGLWLVSSNGLYHALVRSDGNFCTYPGLDPQHQQGPATWCSGVTAPTGTFYAEVKANGSFCIYPGQPGGGGVQAVWCANATAPAGQPPFLIMNGDGNLLLNTGTPDRPTGTYWQSGVVFAQVALSQPQYGSIRWSEDRSGACPPSCARNFLVGSTISLHATPPNGGTFREWTGGRCSGGASVNPCVVQVTAYAPSVLPIGARNTSSPYRFVNSGPDGSPQSRSLWWGPRSGSQFLFAGTRPPDDPSSFFVIDGDTIRPASNRDLCWSYHAVSRSIAMESCGSPSAGSVQTGWMYRGDDRTIRNTNFARTCVEFNSDGFAIMSQGACFVDDPRAPGAWWVSRWNLQP